MAGSNRNLHTVIARETAEALADQDPPMLASRVGQRVAFADAARTGRLASESDTGQMATRDIEALADELDGLAQ